MKVERSTVEKLMITDVPGLDPIAVIVENFGPGQGKITITCFGEAWSSYWPGMGEKNDLAKFFCSCDEHYLAKNLKVGIHARIDDDDEDALVKLLRGKIIERRREGNLDHELARDLWDRTRDVCISNYERHELCSELLGDEWWYLTPKKSNPDYEYLCRIIKTVQEALKGEPQ